MPDYTPQVAVPQQDAAPAPVLTFNPFTVQAQQPPQQAAPQQMQQPQAAPQQAQMAPPQPVAQQQSPAPQQAPAPTGSGAAPVLTFNPFTPRDVGQQGLPTNILPNPQMQAQQAAQTPPVPSTPGIPATPDTGATVDQKTASLLKAGGTAAGQGIVEGLQGINEFAADTAQKLHIVSPSFVEGVKAGYASERAQYANLSFIKENPGTSDLVKQNIAYGLGLAVPGGAAVAGARALGLGAGVFGNIAADALGNAVAGGLQSPGQSQTPFEDRAMNAGVAGVTGGLLSAPFRYFGGLKGEATPERITAQQANAAALEPVGGGTVGQIIGDTNDAGAYGNPKGVGGMPGQNLQGAEVALSKVPFVGNKGGLLDQQGALRNTQKDFVKNLSPNPADIAHLTPEEVADAVNTETPLPDAAISKAYSTIKDTADASGPVSLDAVIPDIQKLNQSLMKGPEGQISATASDNVVLSKIKDLSETPNPTFQQLWDFRKNLDDTAFTQAGVLKPSTTASAGLGKLRDAVSTALQNQADKSGFGDQWSNISKQYAQNIGFKKVQGMMDLAYSPLGRGGMSPGRGMLTFARNLDAAMDKGIVSLNPEQKAAALGVIKTTTLMAKQLRMVKPGLEIMTKQSAIGAAALLGGHVAGVPLAGAAGTAGALVAGVSHLLNSGLGRAVLTYAGKQPLTSLKLQSISMNLFKTLVGTGSTSITNNKNNSQYGIQ